MCNLDLIKELYEMCADESFDIGRAIELINDIDVNRPLQFYSSGEDLTFLEPEEKIDPEKEIEWSTFLTSASEHLNYAMCKFLLDKGADPNYEDSNVEPLMSHLRYLGYYSDCDTEDEYQELIYKQLNIVRLLLEYGANPNQYIDHSVYGKHTNMIDALLLAIDLIGRESDVSYLKRFLIYIVAYGADYDDGRKIDFLYTLDKDNLNQYDAKFVKEGDYWFPVITDKDEKIVAWL